MQIECDEILWVDDAMLCVRVTANMDDAGAVVLLSARPKLENDPEDMPCPTRYSKCLLSTLPQGQRIDLQAVMAGQTGI